MTLEAWRACTDVVPDVMCNFSETPSVYYLLAEDYMAEKGKDHAEIIQKKRVLYHIAHSIT
jgi:hypothetical protein